jgi:hypothetical protein
LIEEEHYLTGRHLDSCFLYDEMAVYEEFGGAAVAAEEGVHIANALGPKKKTMTLQNHGYVSANDNIQF